MNENVKNLIVECWNITEEEGEQYIIDVFSYIIDSCELDIRCDILASRMGSVAKSKNIKLLYNNRHRNLNFYMKNRFVNLSTFLENHTDIFEVYSKQKVKYIRLKDYWLDDEKWILT